MKWNWGTGILLVIVVFVGLCVAFLIYASRQDWSLVEKDYYPKELKHEEMLVKMRNANALAEPLVVSAGPEGIRVAFPSLFRGRPLTGSLHVYRPSDERMDVIIDLAGDTSLIRTVPAEKLHHGRYQVKVEWTAGDTTYYLAQDVFIP